MNDKVHWPPIAEWYRVISSDFPFARADKCCRHADQVDNVEFVHFVVVLQQWVDLKCKNAEFIIKLYIRHMNIRI